MEKTYPRIDNGIFQLSHGVAYRISTISYIAIEDKTVVIMMIGMKDQAFRINNPDRTSAEVIYDAIVRNMCGTYTPTVNLLTQAETVETTDDSNGNT